jgi:hypothetical protein
MKIKKKKRKKNTNDPDGMKKLYIALNKASDNHGAYLGEGMSLTSDGKIVTEL